MQILWIILIIAAFSGLAAYEAKPLIQEKQWRELSACYAILALGMIISIFLIMGVRLPGIPWLMNIYSEYMLSLLSAVF